MLFNFRKRVIRLLLVLTSIHRFNNVTLLSSLSLHPQKPFFFLMIFNNFIISCLSSWDERIVTMFYLNHIFLSLLNHKFFSLKSVRLFKEDETLFGEAFGYLSFEKNKTHLSFISSSSLPSSCLDWQLIISRYSLSPFVCHRMQIKINCSNKVLLVACIL